MRTVEETITFAQSFLLPGWGERLPPGTYRVEHGEERIDSLSFPAYRRVSTLFYIPGHAGGTRTLKLEPDAFRKLSESARVGS